VLPPNLGSATCCPGVTRWCLLGGHCWCCALRVISISTNRMGMCWVQPMEEPVHVCKWMHTCIESSSCDVGWTSSSAWFRNGLTMVCTRSSFTCMHCFTITALLCFWGAAAWQTVNWPSLRRTLCQSLPQHPLSECDQPCTFTLPVSFLSETGRLQSRRQEMQRPSTHTVLHCMTLCTEPSN
jgi:hypothetical protein